MDNELLMLNKSRIEIQKDIKSRNLKLYFLNLIKKKTNKALLNSELKTQ